MFLKNSLNRHLGWVELLTVLGKPPKHQMLPAVADCPLCSATLEVYRDTLELGQWYRCRGCRFHGDGLELAMRAWQLSLDDTVERVLRSGFEFEPGESLPESLEHYAEFRPGRRQQARSFWEAAQETARLYTNPGAAGLQRQFTRDLHWSVAEWARRGGVPYGVSTRTVVETVWQPGNVAYRKRGGDGSKHRAGGGGDRIFTGSGWDNLLVVPYQDLPGRITGFLFIGRDGRPQTDWAYHSVQSLHLQAREEGGMEAGIAFLHALDSSGHPKFGDRAFVFDDPVLALRMHLLHAAEHESVLPVLASWDGPDYRTLGLWDQLPPRPLVLCGPRFTPNLIRQARRTGGLLALVPPSIVAELGTNRPETALAWLEKHAVGWEEAVTYALGLLPPGEAAEFFRQLKLPDLDVSRLVQGAPPEVRKRVEAITHGNAPVRLLPYGQQKIEILPGCWRFQKSKELVTDAPFVIDQVLHRTNSGRTQYKGTITFRNQQYPFLAQADVFDAAPFRWIKDFLIRSGAGMPAFKQKLSQPALQFAQQLKTPEYVAVPDAVGWQESAGGWVFPTFTLRCNGQVEPLGSGLPPLGAFPCRHFAPPRDLTALELEALGTGEPQVELFWATAAVVLAGVLAPAARLALQNVALVGRVAQLAGRYAAEQLGCVVLAPRTGNQNATAVKDAQALLALHAWPLCVLRPPNEVHLTVPASVLGSLPQPVLVGADPLDAGLCALDPSWLVLDTAARCARPSATPAGAAAVAPAYLQDLARRRLNIDLGVDPAAAVLDDLADWFARQGGDAGVINAARGLFVVGGATSGADRLAHLLTRALDTGACFRQGEGERYRQGRAALTWTAGGSVHVPETALRRIATGRSFPAPDARLISEALQAGGVPYSEVELGGELGWLVPADWLDRQLRRFRAQTRGYLKLAGS